MIAHALLLPIFAIDDRSTRHLRPVYRSYRRQRRPVPVGAAFDPTNAIVINPVAHMEPTTAFSRSQRRNVA
jgi:hypothetical protein